MYFNFSAKKSHNTLTTLKQLQQISTYMELKKKKYSAKINLSKLKDFNKKITCTCCNQLHFKTMAVLSFVIILRKFYYHKSTSLGIICNFILSNGPEEAIIGFYDDDTLFSCTKTIFPTIGKRSLLIFPCPIMFIHLENQR